MPCAHAVLAGVNSVLRNRVYTALGLAGLTLATIFLAPLWLFGLIFGIAASIGAYEWAAFAGWTDKKQRLQYVGALWVVGIVGITQAEYWPQFIVGVCVLWLLGFISILLHPKFSWIYRKRWFVAVLGWTLMLCAWLCLVTLFQQEHGHWWLLWLFVLTTATDVGAFFAGRAFGQHALAPKVSPAKTREGAAGGTTLALIICAGGLFLAGAVDFYTAIGLTLVMSLISILGDLFESLLKRVSGVKDSGDILPGHGGVLDRIDSIVAVLPFLVWSIA